MDKGGLLYHVILHWQYRDDHENIKNRQLQVKARGARESTLMGAHIPDPLKDREVTARERETKENSQPNGENHRVWSCNPKAWSSNLFTKFLWSTLAWVKSI
jgi:hypothetical protein